MTSNTRTVQATRRRVNPTTPEVEGFDFTAASFYIIQNEAGSFRCIADMDDSQPVLEPTMICGKWGEATIVGVKEASGVIHGTVPDENMPLRVMGAPAPVVEEGAEEVAQAA